MMRERIKEMCLGNEFRTSHQRAPRAKWATEAVSIDCLEHTRISLSERISLERSVNGYERAQNLD